MSKIDTCVICGNVGGFSSATPCPVCGFTYFGNLTDSVPLFDYEAGYRSYSDDMELPPDAVLRHYAQSQNISWAFGHLARRSGESSLHLVEFGASQGAFVRLCADRGYDPIGYEISTDAVEYGRRRLGLGEHLRLGSWRARGSEERAVDVACAFETLEHLSDPVQRLREIATWTKPGGWIILSVPNERRLAVRLNRREAEDFPPHHLCRWTTTSMDTALRAAGLRPLEITVSALSRSDILGVLSPRMSASRAVELNSFRPVASQVTERDSVSMSRWVSRSYPALLAIGSLVAFGMNLMPELGSRMLVLAEVLGDE